MRKQRSRAHALQRLQSCQPRIMRPSGPLVGALPHLVTPVPSRIWSGALQIPALFRALRCLAAALYAFTSDSGISLGGNLTPCQSSRWSLSNSPCQFSAVNFAIILCNY